MDMDHTKALAMTSHIMVIELLGLLVKKASSHAGYWVRVSLTPRIRARGAEMADFFGYRPNGPEDVLSQHRHGGL